MSMGSAAPAGAVDNVVARIERLPTSWWHVKTRIIVGVATFFDAFDAIAIATVLPVLVPMWKLTGPDIGFMISAGYVGQLIGALLFGWIGERYGRMPAMIGSIAVFGVMSLVCAFAWDYNSLLWFRTLQGIGLGGEVPVAATYISELTRAQEPRPLRAAVRAGVSDRARGGEPDSRFGWCRISAGNGCSTSARCRRCSRWCCAHCFRNRRAGSPCTAATPRRTPRCR